ncbi:2-amino-thiazoline-4-carboxylic acid hydrolase [Pseudothauera nasutitermitis]|uniref:2-amino-thiazoline-4-carboxylic acid hydrolase n=1 Tax=Pseudothauera nasutitermitis TaxID=2565930 RepID=A0A4S4B3J1_9RHOO|nr:L-2-amino-thiazoline-4-carboxylic acid hydrolase [Pseudothauera nasutitermitis]THF67222.1 2-amino-thiazoline-4-carboxylic acid hydrolase [Pseudothauera nasutitermitis]
MSTTAPPSADVLPPIPADLGILVRRRIEAEIIKPIYDILERELGEERAGAIIDEAVTAAAVRAAGEMAAREPAGGTLQGFIAIQPLWTRDGALEVEVRKQDARRFDFDVTRCRYAEMYRALGLGKIGHLLSCNRDAAFIAGFAPEVKFSRTQTIMQGAPHCDFRYGTDTPPATP